MYLWVRKLQPLMGVWLQLWVGKLQPLMGVWLQLWVGKLKLGSYHRESRHDQVI